MAVIGYLVVLGSLAIFALAQEELTTSSHLQDYSALWQRNLENAIFIAERKIDAMDIRAADNIKLLKEQHSVFLEQIVRNEQSLIPMQALSRKRKHCVLKFKGELVKVETAEAEFTSCIVIAQNRVNSLTTAAKSNLASAKLRVFAYLPKALTNCNSTYYNNSLKLEECTLSNIDTYTESVQASLRLVDKNLDASECSASDLSMDAILCTMATERNTTLIMGRVMYAIDTCTKDNGPVCNCPLLPWGNITSTTTTTAASFNK